MLQADRIDFEPAKVYKQKGPTCSVHAFFTILAEHVQNKFGIDVEFDMYEVFERMEKERKLPGNRKSRYSWLMWTGVYRGYTTLNGEVVYIKGFGRLYKNTPATYMKKLQLHGPILARLKMYENVDLSPKGDTIEVPDDLGDPTGSNHAIAMRGFDNTKDENKNPKEKYGLHNSWGKNKSVKNIPMEGFHRICIGGYSIYDVTIEV